MINLVALPCLCVDVFDGTDELRAGGEALNFAVHASKFEEFNVSILGAVGQDSYAKFIMDSVSDKRIDVSHVRVEEDKVTANNRTYLTADGDRYYKDDSWTGDIVDKMISGIKSVFLKGYFISCNVSRTTSTIASSSANTAIFLKSDIAPGTRA